MADGVVSYPANRKLRSDETGPCAVLYPAIAEAARRVGATTIGLVDLRRSGSLDHTLNLDVDRVGITYSDGATLGDPSSPVQVSCRVVGDGTVPSNPLPTVAARIGLERDPVGFLLDAVSRVPADATPVVMTTWALSKLSPPRRVQFVDRLREAGADRPLAWVSVEGVGVAPGASTFGDRPASGHSIIGVAVFDGPTGDIESMGRCWSRGSIMSWLAAARENVIDTFCDMAFSIVVGMARNALCDRTAFRSRGGFA